MRKHGVNAHLKQRANLLLVEGAIVRAMWLARRQRLIATRAKMYYDIGRYAR